MFKNKTIIVGILAVALAGVAFFLYENHTLNVAHSTFENYYAFRGCTELIDRTDTYGDCKTSDGQTIKIVKINNAWYLEGDGPGVW